MIKRNQKFIRFLNISSDAILVFLSYLVAVWLKYVVIDRQKIVWLSEGHAFIVLAYSILIPLAYYVMRIYTQSRIKNESGEYVTIVLVNAFGAVSLAALFYVVRLTEFSREAVLLFWVFSSLLVVAKHFLGRRFIMLFRELGYNQRHVIIVGNGKHAFGYIRDITNQKRLGFELDGYVSAVEKEGLGKCLGSYEDLEEIIEKFQPDELVVALEPHEVQFVSRVLDAAGKEGVAVSLIPFYNDYIPPHPEIESFGNTRLINMRATPMDFALGAFVKRAGDIVISLLAILLLSPLMAAVAIGVKLSSPGPVLFRQERVGKNKKSFYMLKFRSMRINEAENTAWSTPEDSRKTAFGSFIRKCSMDELPQLFNVLKGDMSLVGPRPELPFYVRRFKEDVPLYLVRQQVRPGMTGWAQVHGLRGDTSIEARVEYDIWYIENWSIMLDIKILLMTLFKGCFINDEKLIGNSGSNHFCKEKLVRKIRMNRNGWKE